MLVSELKEEEERVMWMGDEESEVVLIPSERAGVVLRWDALKRWIEECGVEVVWGEGVGGGDERNKVGGSLPAK